MIVSCAYYISIAAQVCRCGTTKQTPAHDLGIRRGLGQIGGCCQDGEEGWSPRTQNAKRSSNKNCMVFGWKMDEIYMSWLSWQFPLDISGSSGYLRNDHGSAKNGRFFHRPLAVPNAVATTRTDLSPAGAALLRHPPFPGAGEKLPAFCHHQFDDQQGMWGALAVSCWPAVSSPPKIKRYRRRQVKQANRLGYDPRNNKLDQIKNWTLRKKKTITFLGICKFRRGFFKPPVVSTIVFGRPFQQVAQVSSSVTDHLRCAEEKAEEQPVDSEGTKWIEASAKPMAHLAKTCFYL